MRWPHNRQLMGFEHTLRVQRRKRTIHIAPRRILRQHRAHHNLECGFSRPPSGRAKGGSMVRYSDSIYAGEGTPGTRFALRLFIVAIYHSPQFMQDSPHERDSD